MKITKYILMLSVGLAVFVNSCFADVEKMYIRSRGDMVIRNYQDVQFLEGWIDWYDLGLGTTEDNPIEFPYELALLTCILEDSENHTFVPALAAKYDIETLQKLKNACTGISASLGRAYEEALQIKGTMEINQVVKKQDSSQGCIIS